MATRSRQVLRLYKDLLREAEKFPSYMYRTYSLRRIKDAFREHKAETDYEKIDDLITYGNANLDIIKRQCLKVLSNSMTQQNSCLL
ncbi:LYR motif-containing protein 4 [Argiope bruennichi]|uniref:LYR motif-containing protein 4 n=1 Tax=Argiope bruennichi TaxID=94029 RepID=A0A8T0EWX6_ARGBR|nr:LYR motif-containing protein 4 [Argiope bruennichi]